MIYTKENANKYISENKDKVNKKYRLEYHMMPPIGWMNDPNGLVKFNDEYHLFYQFHPYEAKWGPMHWGHFVSKDLIKYEDASVGLAPDLDEEHGCWSGCAIADNGLNLIYTRHYEVDDFKIQKQYLAKSCDGYEFSKEEKALFNNDELPSNVSRRDFRDPYVITKNGYYYMFVGGTLDTNEGVIIVLKSDHLGDFKYDFMIGPLYELGNMGECPSYYHLDGIDVIVACGCGVKSVGNNFKNINSSVFIIGNIDFDNKKMDIKLIKEIDNGDCFYCPQFINSNDELIMISWMEMWGKDYPTYDLGHNWVGAFTIPRKLNWKNNKIYQSPIDEIKKYYKKSYLYSGEKMSRVSDISFELNNDSSIKFSAVNGSFEIGLNDKVYLKNEYCTRYSNNSYSKVNIRMLLDKSSIELFINDGEETITTRVYLDSDYTLDVKNVDKIFVNEIEV